MEPKFQTSFIPKTPVVASSSSFVGSKPKSLTLSILPIIGNIIFILTLISYGALYGYERLLKNQISQSDQELVHARAAYDPSSAEQLIVASEQIQSAKNLLNKHIAVSNIFALLESNVLPDVKFTSFSFEGSKDLVSIIIVGEASSYASLAQQSNIFSKIKSIQNPNFSDLKLTEKGNVAIKFDANIKPDLISYTQEDKTRADNTEAPANSQ